jgi:hypothetical protein
MAIRRGDWLAAATALALLTHCVAANALLMTTAPETETFDLTPEQVVFQVSNDGAEPPVIINTNNGPTTTQSLLNFNQFDPSLGVLSGVTISFASEYTLAPSLSVTFFPDSFNLDPIDYFADGSLDLSLTGPGLISAQSLGPTASATCTATDEPCNSSDPPTIGNFDGSTSGLSLAPFIGLGTFDLTAALSSALAPRIIPDNGTGFADNATMDGTLDSNWAGRVSVVYAYDAPATGIPEPLTLYLVVAGLLGIALLPRRRAQQN